MKNKDVSKTNSDEFVGEKYKVISNVGRYEIKIRDVVYEVLPTKENEVLNIDDYVEIVQAKGNKLLVKKIIKKD